MIQEKVVFGDKEYQFTWVKGGEVPKDKITQVSGYVFDNDQKMLIVKNKNWTIPGGHPEGDEAPIDTLKREVLEESQIEIDDIKYLGFVEVLDIEKDTKQYQLRFTARAQKEKEFKGDFETTERTFVDPVVELSNYIPWASGKVFSREIEDAILSFNL